MLLVYFIRIFIEKKFVKLVIEVQYQYLKKANKIFKKNENYKKKHKNMVRHRIIHKVKKRLKKQVNELKKKNFRQKLFGYLKHFEQIKKTKIVEHEYQFLDEFKNEKKKK